ncbi:MAG: hypothetical protein K8H88_28185, partial [Sandaracinaceae bacterium]|nr:hypothetical protein [Sandaracinaceae bacterium]
MRSLLVLLLLTSSACTGTSAATDAGSRQDASARADSGPRDGGNSDGGGGDAGYDAYIPFPPPPPPPCDAMSVFMGDPTMSVEVGLFDASSLFVPVADGATMPTQWGVQGGTMIIPVIALDASLPQASLCARVELVNRPDPAFPDNAGELAGFAGLTFDVMFVRREGRLISDGIQDQ